MADLVKRLWQWWKRVAERIGNVQARILLTAFYCIAVLPVALILKLLADPLALQRGRGRASWWLHRKPQATELDEGRRQS